MTRYETILNGAALWGAYYRENPDKFAKDYLHLNLKRFQKMLIVMMFWCTTFVLIACRGLGKTFMCAVYCVTRCILYPKSRICIVSGTRGQANLVLEKIMQELRPKSPELCNEIDERQTNITGFDAHITFKNNSIIKVVTASDSARGNRCNVLVLDEFRLISWNMIETVLKHFLKYRRMPDYIDLTQEERNAEYSKEKNLTMYLSSAWFKNHWAYTKCQDAFDAMVNPERRQFVCGFPYQLAILEGLIGRENIMDDMAESNFSAIKFAMEMQAEFYGSTEDAFFDFDSISKNRKIRYPMLPNDISSRLGSPPSLKIQPKEDGEIRLLSADIALMSSQKHKNDAAALFINRLIPSRSGRYISNIVFPESCEGLRTEDQALEIRKMFTEYDCDYLIMDTMGIGLGCYDSIAKDMVDPETGEFYPALSCCNDKTMADRCTVPNAPKVIWSIKASAQFNSDVAFLLREGFRSGRIRLLANEYEGEAALSEIKGYKSLEPSEQIKFFLPYIQTTLLVDELVNLQHEEANGKLKVYEKSGMRKDRYSSLAYNYYVAVQLENKIVKKTNFENDVTELFLFRAPSYSGRVVNYGRGDKKSRGWYG